MRILTYILLVLIIILGVSFAVLNGQAVTFNYYVGKHVMPLSLLLVLSFCVGSLLSLCVSLFIYFKQRISYYKLNQRFKLAEKEIENLRSMPIKDTH